jgi:hypothetical protein
MWQSQCNTLQWAICHFCIQNIFLVLQKYIRISLLLSNDHHMNARNLLEHWTYLDIHIMEYKIDKVILVVSLIGCQITWFLLQPLPCNKNRSYCFYIEQIQYIIYVLWQNYIKASVYLHRHWYVSNVSIIFYAPCLFLHHLPNVSLHFVALLCIFWN